MGVCHFNNISNGIDSLVKNFPLGNEHKGEGIVGKIICDLYNDSEKLNLNGKWQEKVMERNDTYKEYAD